MTPPMDKGTQATSQVTSAPQAVSALAQPKLTKMTKRAEFLRAANAKRQAAPGFWCKPGRAMMAIWSCG